MKEPLTRASESSVAAPLLRRAALKYVLATGCILLLLYALAYHPWSSESFAGKQLQAYLGLVASASAAVLRLLGEFVSQTGTTVTGRFSYVVVVDCAALDVQAMFVAAVLAFPSRWFTRLVGLFAGIAAIFVINIVRLVALYYAGAHSPTLFKTLHEEVFVLIIVGLVCGLFVVWATWATMPNRNANQALPEAG